jgi:hypothetical protein
MFVGSNTLAYYAGKSFHCAWDKIERRKREEGRIKKAFHPIERR